MFTCKNSLSLPDFFLAEPNRYYVHCGTKECFGEWCGMILVAIFRKHQAPHRALANQNSRHL